MESQFYKNLVACFGVGGGSFYPKLSVRPFKAHLKIKPSCPPLESAGSRVIDDVRALGAVGVLQHLAVGHSPVVEF